MTILKVLVDKIIVFLFVAGFNRPKLTRYVHCKYIMGNYSQSGSTIGKCYCDVSSCMAGVHSIDSCHGS